MPGLFPSCAETARRISEHADDSLTRTSRIGLWLHLCACRFCRRYLKQIRFLDQAMHHYPDHLAELSRPKLTVEARNRIVEALRRSP